MEDKITLLYMYVFYSRNYNKVSNGLYHFIFTYYRTMLSSTTWKVILVFVFPDIKNNCSVLWNNIHLYIIYTL